MSLNVAFKSGIPQHSWHWNKVIKPALSSFNNTLADYEKDFREAIDAWENAGIVRHNPFSSNLTFGNGVNQFEINFNNKYGQLNQNILSPNNSDDFIKSSTANSGDRLTPQGTFSTGDDIIGAYNWNRRPTIHESIRGSDFNEWANHFNNLGYKGAYIYKHHWIPTKNTSGDNTYVSFDNLSNPIQDDSWKQYLGIVKEESNKKYTKEDIVKGTELDMSKSVRAVETPKDTPKKNWLGTLFSNKNISNFLELGRYFGDIWNNNKVYDITKAGMSPGLLLSYNLHTQVFGDEAAKLLYYRRAAQLQTRAGQPLTSDATLQNALMMEGYARGNDLRALGDLLDNLRIFDTSKRSEELQWANLERDTRVANENTLRRLQYSKDLAALEAGHQSANWTSTSNLISGIEERLRQGVAKDEALADQIRLLDWKDTLDTDSTLKQAREDLNKNPQNIDAQKRYKERYRELYREYLESQRSGWFFAKSGGKIEHTKKSDLLYKKTKDAVEHFRKMYKMSTKDRKLKAVNTVVKMQLGGVAPFTIFTPVTLGGSTKYSTASGSGSKKEEKDEGLDLLKNLFSQVVSLKGLPSDVKYLYDSVRQFFTLQDTFGESMDSSDISNMYLELINIFPRLLAGKANFEDAKKIAAENDALGEYAINERGECYVITEDGIKATPISNIQEGDHILTNSDLLNLREYNTRYALEDGETFLRSISNSIGVNKIGEKLKALLPNIGTREIIQQGYTKHEAEQIVKGLEALLAAPSGVYELKVHTKDQAVLSDLALRYIDAMLPINMKRVLDIHARENRMDRKSLIGLLVGSTLNSLVETTYDPITGRAAASKSGTKNNESGIKLDAAIALISGKGYLLKIELNPGTSYSASVNGRYSAFLKKSGENMGLGITMQEATTSTLGDVLDWNKATLGGSRIIPIGYNHIILNNNDVVGMDLPIDAEGNPDFSTLSNLQKLDLELLKAGIEDTPLNWLKVNELCAKLNIPPKYSGEGKLNELNWARFAAFQGITDDTPLVNKNAILSELLVEGNDEVRNLYDSVMKKNDKNYELDNGWLFGKGQPVYQGTVFVPIRKNYVNAILSGGLNLSIEDTEELQLLEHNYNPSLIPQQKSKTYNKPTNLPSDI